MTEEESKQQLSGAIGKIAKTGGVAFGIYDLLRNAVGIGVFILLLIFFMSRGLPLYAGIPFIAVIFLIYVLKIIRVKRIASVNLNTNVEATTQASEKINLTPEEKVVTTVAGIIRTLTFGAPLIRSKYALGVGEIRQPENSIIVTDRHVLFIYAPLSGGNKIISDADIGVVGWLLARKDMESKLGEMLSSMSLEQVYQSHPKNFGISLDNIAKTKFSNWRRNVIFITKDNKKYSYGIRVKEDYIKLKEVFVNYS